MTTAVASQTNYKSVLKWGTLSAIAALNGYVCVLMYSRGETAFAMLTLVLTALAVYVFGSKKNYAHRYTYPGIAGMILFIIFPLVYTVGLAFTNYSATNQVTLERAQAVQLTKTYQSGKSYSFQLMNQGNGYVLTIKDSGQLFATETFNLAEAVERKLELAPVDSVKGKKATIKQIIAKRPNLNLITLSLPSGEAIQMSGLRKFAAVGPLFVMQEDGETLYNNKTETYFKANHDTGFYQEVDDNDVFVGDPISPGFIVNVGGANFERIWKDDGIKEPFISIFIWTVIFATCTVVFTLAIGLVLAAVVQWEELKGRAVYRLLLILPYAVPAFISILIFRGLFNQSFGEINMLLDSMFGIQPNWFSDPFTAKVMVLIVNTWLGFPYMMILCMGLLKSIPEDLYEASAIDGAGPFQNFMKITVPMMVKPLTPLLIAAFAFNFNNFVMIALLTKGGPNMIGTTEPAGYTDLLVSYTYRIAFEGSGGQDFGLASAIATLIFLLVGGLALLNLRFTKLSNN